MLVTALAAAWWCCTPILSAATFTPLIELSAPKLKAFSPPFPGGSYQPEHLVDGLDNSEYSSASNGTNTFVEFEFPNPVLVAAFRHRDRNDPATVAASELTLYDGDGRLVQTLPVTHVNQRAGETLVTLPAPVTAKTVRWKVTRLGSQYATVGGAEITFYTAGSPEPVPTRLRLKVSALPFQRRDVNTQPFRLEVFYPYAAGGDATLQIGAITNLNFALRPGKQILEFNLPAVDKETELSMSLSVAGLLVAKQQYRQTPVRPLTVYVLPHSHTDIGYTALQTEIEKKQVQNLVDGMAYARRTADYPEGARFVWNVEVLWAADLYLRRLDEVQRKEFLQAVRRGEVALCGMYLNELTGVCRPEELLRLFRFATTLAAATGVPIDTAMISDVPGYTWGVVPAMNHAGIKYFSTAPNYFDRIGDILLEWENKPFYWLGPDGRSKVLVWIPFWGYAMSHRYHQMSPRLVEEFCEGLAKRNYPYEIAYVRWSGHGDNAPPDPAICDFIRDWNAQYQWPRFVIASASEAFRQFEARHGHQLPVVRGEWSPYWEDGVGSSAAETALNRASADRLAQAESLFAMFQPAAYPVAAAHDAWNYVLLYSEHTWGAWCSVSQPEHPETVSQWAVKQSYALEAARRSSELHTQALSLRDGAPVHGAVDIVNTLGWPRTELVCVPQDLSRVGDLVLDDRGRAVPAQRLRDGSLVFIAENVPPLGARRYRLADGPPAPIRKSASVKGCTMANDRMQLVLDPQRGSITELTMSGQKVNLVDSTAGEGLNEYVYFNGDNPAEARRPVNVRIEMGEPGPLVASLIVESRPAGCRLLRQEYRLAAGADYVECLNFVDKERLAAKSYLAREGKESLNFAFPFAIPRGELRLGLPIGAIRPHADLLPSACKNWFSVGRWADVSAAGLGVTWVTLDAPLVQVGGLTANLLNSQSDPKVWRATVEPTQRIYSWAMNNHWGTNYRAYQEGPAWFRFLLWLHGRSDDADRERFAVAASFPLLAVEAKGPAPVASLFRIEPEDVDLLSLKPSDDGHALIARLYGASGKTRQAALRWGSFRPTAVHLSDISETPGPVVRNTVTVPGYGVVTLRLEL
jgi:alpha-mannosidase